MTLTIFQGKLKCASCTKIIPASKVLMLAKTVDELQEVKINHLCLPCHTYSQKQRKEPLRLEIFVYDV